MKKVLLKKYIEKFKEAGILVESNIASNLLNSEINYVSYDNRKLKGNSLFICKGAAFRDIYAQKAIENGALAYISERKIDGLDSCIIVSDIRTAIVISAKLLYDNSPNFLKTVGITGTKGKGCVAYILRGIINKYLEYQNSPECAFLTSVRTYDGILDFESHMTTPETLELYEHFDNARISNISHLIMEVSSLGIKFGRTSGINYEVACFTNFGEDHISDIEHPDMEDYFKSKLRIFDNAKYACVNLDSVRADEIVNYAKKNCNIMTFSMENDAMVSAKNIVSYGSYIEFDLRTPIFEEHIKLGVPGMFNVSNALAAISIALCLNIPKEFIIQGLAEAEIPGRMCVFSSDDKMLNICVDYAHNKMSIDALFSSLKKEHLNSKVVGIFGSAGNKAINRRVDIPATASKYCDKIVICEDDPNFEKFEDIAAEMVKNISIKDYEVIKDRVEALNHVVEQYDWNTPLVIGFCGKGDEEYIIRNGKYEPYISDFKAAKNAITEYNNKH